MKDERGYIVTFGLGGHHIEGENWMLSGYDDPDSFQRRLNAGKVDNYILEGVPVVDLREAVKNRPAYAFLAPLVDVRLEGNTIDRLNVGDITGSIMCQSMMGDAGNQYGTLLKMQSISTEPGPLDKVSVNYLVRWWCERGARIGKISGNQILWEE